MSGRCPDAETLAAYIDGELVREQRERLEEHLAGCAECTAVIAGALRFQGAAEARPARRARWRAPSAAALVAALVAAVVGLVVGLTLRSAPAAHDARAELLGRVAGRRPIVPRLTGGFRWAPANDIRRGGAMRGSNGTL